MIARLVVFGYNGYCVRDSLNNIYPGSEVYYNDSIKLFIDSTQLDIRRYLDFEKDSAIKIARRMPRSPLEFFITDGLDLIAFQETINKVLINNRYRDEYYFNDSIPRFYDGGGYSLYYETSNGQSYLINYLPPQLPDSLLIIHNLIENIIESTPLQITNSFRFDTITLMAANRLYRKHHGPPLRDNTIKGNY